MSKKIFIYLIVLGVAEGYIGFKLDIGLIPTLATGILSGVLSCYIVDYVKIKRFLNKK